MADTVSQQRRSEIMSRIRDRDTKPEMAVRRLVHVMGYRYRLHRRDLPGKPDLAFPGMKKAIFVHGCFWHQHEDTVCRKSSLPKTNQEFWLPKLRRNAERDAEQQAQLAVLGWDILVIWECETAKGKGLAERIGSFLERGQKKSE